ADDPAADDEHPLRDERKRERTRGVDDARIVGQERQARRARADGDDRLLEADDLALAALPGGLDLEPVRVEEAPVALHDAHLAALRHRRDAAGELADDLLLVRA